MLRKSEAEKEPHVSRREFSRLLQSAERTASDNSVCIDPSFATSERS
jgi:hypothetical protein